MNKALKVKNGPLTDHLPDPVPGSEFPKMMFRPMTDEEKEKHLAHKKVAVEPRDAFRSKIVHSMDEQDLLGEEWVEHLNDIEEIAKATGYVGGIHMHEPVEAAMAADDQQITQAVDEDVLNMDEETLRTLLVEKHGYSARKLKGKSLEQLRAIFSS